MIPENRIVIAGVIVGIIGAMVGGCLGYFAREITDGDPNWLAFPTGIATGFLACFLLSILYLKWTNEPYTHTVTLNLNKPNPAPLMRRRLANVIGGLKFSVSAGVISAALTGFSMPISHGDYDPLEYIFCAAYGVAVFGIPAGVIAWIILSIVYIVFVKKPLSENNKMQHLD